MSTQFLAESITFVLMLALIVVLGWPRLMRAATKQQDAISASLTEAEKQRKEAAAALAQSDTQLATALQQVEEILTRARQEALELAQEASARAEAESRQLLAQAEVQIAAERDQAIQQLRHGLADAVVDTASRVLSGAITPAGHRALMDDTLGRLALTAPESN